MRRTYRPFTSIILSILSLVGFGWAAYAVDQDRMKAFDDYFIRHVQGLETETLTKLLKAVTYIGTTVPVIVIMLIVIAILLATKRLWKESLFLVWVMLGEKLLNDAVKSWFARPRPTIHRLVEETDFSFPSGHAMASICLYGALLYFTWRFSSRRSGRIAAGVIAAAIVLLIGGSRIYLGVHYPSDVLGGYLLGGFWLAASAGIFQRIADRTSRAQRSKESATTTF
ncbi:phosphatase PAP2 family protein [Cohnella lubricantis]|uniref:Phosphatase PAP2 family protein n=1 Tax=Cohnella lubricantis TaxID=2163172 RepID=A0A841TCH2_9BACL|nr:phosphatase PAP2 family protein [Cohnella lubricantis]MBB6676151.1 phosphatase PAP2 family protein [Cohnella lubricantis]MBP2118657.1 undecaprenyl-diphosphatase [Cohnella lubricantis]